MPHRTGPWIAFAFAVSLAAAGCYSSARAARVSQTLDSTTWTCLGDPIVICPDGECTGWDSQWIATCPDDGRRWVCRFARGRGSRVYCGRQDTSPQPTAATAAEPATSTAPSATAPVATTPDPQGRDALAAQAARDHDCVPDRIAVDADHSESQGAPAFWLTVCGAQRFYRWDGTANRFVDVTP